MSKVQQNDLKPDNIFLIDAKKLQNSLEKHQNDAPVANWDHIFNNPYSYKSQLIIDSNPRNSNEEQKIAPRRSLSSSTKRIARFSTVTVAFLHIVQLDFDFLY